MPERRMFAKTIIDSDAFIDMPLSTQSLYFHLSMRGDDDGFINNPRKIQRMIGASDDDLKLLIAKNFIIPFESGVVVIKHWKIHNYLRGDRYKETVYTEEKALLKTKKNGAYTLMGPVNEMVGIPDGNQMDTNGIPMVYQMDTKDSIGKVSIDKVSIDKANKTTAKRFCPPTIAEVSDYCKERNNNIDAEQFINYYSANGWKVGRNAMKDWKAAVRTWEKNGYSNTKTANKPNPALEYEQRDYSDVDLNGYFMDLTAKGGDNR